MLPTWSKMLPTYAKFDISIDIVNCHVGYGLQWNNIEENEKKS